MTALETRLISLQQQLEHLHTEVAALLGLTSVNVHSSVAPTVSTTAHSPAEPKLASPRSLEAPVGINRYRQLADEQAGYTAKLIERHVIRRKNR